MGATTFVTTAKGKTAKEAFNAAVKEAKYNYGNSGYTGTIAEKDSFVEIALPSGVSPIEAARSMTISRPDIQDTWGPAGCFKVGTDEYMFFGWASE